MGCFSLGKFQLNLIAIDCVFEGEVDISPPSHPRYHLQNTNSEKLAQIWVKVTS